MFSLPSIGLVRRLAAVLALALLAIPASHAQDAALQRQARAQPEVRDSCDPLQGGTIRVPDDSPESLRQARISWDQAHAAVVAAFPEATVTEIEIDKEDGFLVYEVEFRIGRQKYEAYVDAGTGALLCTEYD